MKKLLHERLREAARNGVSSIETCDENIVVSLLKDEELSLANEIEKYYIPRPRFEDGEPVQSSDMEEIGGLATCRVYTDGSWKFNPDKYEDERNPKPWDEQKGRQCDFIKRPEPKVLDADGVPCKKGETVWEISDSTKWEVTDIHPTEPRIAVRQLDTEKKVVGGWFLAKEYSHREPDSLQRIQQLASDWAHEDNLSNSSAADFRDVMEEISNRLTAIMERDV